MTSRIHLYSSGQVVLEHVDDDLASRLRNDHRLVFVAVNGIPPWPCEFCGDLVEGLSRPFNGVVHHLDHDHLNNDPANLTAAHHPCHNSHHHTGRVASDETRARLSAAQKAAGVRGRAPRPPVSDATRARLSAAISAHYQRVRESRG